MVVDLKKKIFSKEPKFESLIMNVANCTMHNAHIITNIMFEASLCDAETDGSNTFHIYNSNLSFI